MTAAVSPPRTQSSRLRVKRFLVIGATGHVGSMITGRLAERGYDVTALVRRPDAVIKDLYNGVIKYVVGDLSDEASIRMALGGIDVVISTANGIIPQKKGDHARSVNEGAMRLSRFARRWASSASCNRPCRPSRTTPGCPSFTASG